MTEDILEVPLEKAYKSVSDIYKGADIDIHDACAKMREISPIYEGDFIAQFGVPTNAGVHQGTKPTFALFRHKDVMNILRDADTYTSGFIAKGLTSHFGGLVVLGMDGEEHRNLRKLLQTAFMPQTVNKWKGSIDEVMRDKFIKPLIPKKKADIMNFGLHFPIRVMYALMGFPMDDEETYNKFAAWALVMVGGNQVDPDKIEEAKANALKASQGLLDAITGIVVDRRALPVDERPDDLISYLLIAEYEGRTLTDYEVATFVRSLLPAAGETTTRTFSCALALMFNTPGLLDRVRADRDLVPKLIDETARFEPVSTFKMRETSKEVEFYGVKIPKGSFVQGMVVSANRDEDVFENPEVFDIDRKQKPSFGFGFGPHMCIGQFVAKMELVSALNACLDLLPNLRLDPDMPKPEIQGAQLRGASEIHVVWD